jgi:acyl carrier protein
MTTAQSPQEREMATLIVDTLNLEGVSAVSIAPEEPLFGTGLGLDSIDALELAVAIATRYGVHLKAEDEVTRQVFASLRRLTAHVEAHRAD